MLRVQLWHFIPADASVNVKDRARVHFTLLIGGNGQLEQVPGIGIGLKATLPARSRH